jgi:signal transduction histidine kinase/DNA-binding response OmpR family regulator
MGNAEIHTQLEAIASLLAFVAGSMALVRYYAKKSSEFLLFGSGFLGAGLLEAYHGVITAPYFAPHTPSALSSLTPWSGAVSRVYVSLLMCATLLIWYRERRNPRARKLRESVVFLATGAWAVVTFIFFAEVHVPPAYYPNLAVHRPAQLVQALFFALAVAGYLAKGKWKNSDFEHSLVLALITATASDLLYMTFYNRLFDLQYIAGHVLKVAMYLFVILGLLRNTFVIFQRAAENAVQLEARVNLRTRELSLANGALGEEIAERRDAQAKLHAAIAAAETASRAKSEFLANMSHEIRTPLNGVIGMTGLALDTELTAEQREYLATVKLSADSLLGLINDILDFSKIEAGKVELETLDFPLRDCLDAILRTVALRAHEKGLELLCEMAPDAPDYVRGDPVRLRQIVLNLVGNAIKFTARGEIALKVSADAEHGADMLHFVVADTGIGIPREKHRAVFEPFSQADASTTRTYGGTGLGLTISTRLVELMGGKIWVESEPGCGTQFHFTVRMARVAAPAADSRALQSMRDVKVLVVDDNATNRRILAAQFAKWRMKSTLAESARDALDKMSAAAQREPYQLVLTDLHMPEMDGFQLAEQIRSRPEYAAVRIMILTSATQRSEAARCQELDISAHLLKPVGQSDLFQAIARALDGVSHTARTAPASLVPSAEIAGRNFLHVLVAEDNAVNQLLVTRMLEKRGHRVVVVGNGKEALHALETGSFDLVLMDLQMPEMDGLTATELLRQREKGRPAHQPVVALTANAMKGDDEKCLAAGMDGYLTKPIRPAELDAVLRTYLERSEELHQLPPLLPDRLSTG